LGWCYAVNVTFDAETVKVKKTNNLPAVLYPFLNQGSTKNDIEVIHFHDIMENVVVERVPLGEAMTSYEPILWSSSG